MIFSDREALKNRIAELTGRRNPERLQVCEDTTVFMAIDFGSVLRLGGNDYLVTVNDLLTDLRALYPAEGDSGDDVA
jgi:hypothetical protein